MDDDHSVLCYTVQRGRGRHEQNRATVSHALRGHSAARPTGGGQGHRMQRQGRGSRTGRGRAVATETCTNYCSLTSLI